ncbi:hypothetical protein [Dactylosporangium sp. NPDC051484]
MILNTRTPLVLLPEATFVTTVDAVIHPSGCAGASCRRIGGTTASTGS